MSVNSYTQGCHLLNHDDVIGTRRVSYILYMPLPYGQVWQKEWGGALELYPVQTGSDGIPEPEAAPSKAIPPSWNQFIFFEVQPGRSFHSVEEVVVGADGVARLSISGWFHAAQEGEEGYQADQAAPELKSSREQLVCIVRYVVCAHGFIRDHYRHPALPLLLHTPNPQSLRTRIHRSERNIYLTFQSS